MTISYEFTQEDMVAWQMHFLRNSKSGRRNRHLQIVLGFIGYLAVLAFAFEKLPLYIASIIGVTSLMPLILYVWKGVDIHTYDQLRQHASDPKIKEAYGKIELSFSEEGMNERTSQTSSLAKWDTVREVVESDNRIFVQMSNGQAAVISKATYSGPVKFEELPGVIDGFKTRFGSNPSKDPTA
jgi:YcxB-like protein